MKREITVTAVLLIIVIVLILGTKFYTGTFENSDAKKFVIEDLRAKYPGADKIEIVSYEKKSSDMGEYYVIKASVSEGLTTSCPKRTHFYYNYPLQNFVPAPPEYVVRNCKVCENNRPCVIAFPEEAIIASHTFPGSEKVHKYILDNKEASPSVTKSTQGWNVVWTSSLNYSYNVLVAENGTIIKVERVEQE